MNADLNELFRLLTNLIRLGTIAEVDYATQRIRVRVGNNLTDWRPWVTLRAGLIKTWCAPSVGEQVILLSPEGDFSQAVVLPAVYSEDNPAPSIDPAQHITLYPDGAIVRYDSSAHQLTVDIPNGSVVVNAQQVTSNAPETTCTGNLTIQKNLIVGGFAALNGGVSAQGADGSNSAVVVHGNVEVTRDVVANGISLTGHHHGGVKGGDEKSGVAQ